MSPTWRREDSDELKEARRIQVELAESASVLATVSQRLLALVAEINAESEADKNDDD